MRQFHRWAWGMRVIAAILVVAFWDMMGPSRAYDQATERGRSHQRAQRLRAEAVRREREADARETRSMTEHKVS
ncbi:MAG TPA: hypothetical protein VGQ26_25280, partial [Streptosporangiaceae bacterium]|nr:hypothetical protein [Streptosporangiaceae bacterium]